MTPKVDCSNCNPLKQRTHCLLGYPGAGHRTLVDGISSFGSAGRPRGKRPGPGSRPAPVSYCMSLRIRHRSNRFCDGPVRSRLSDRTRATIADRVLLEVSRATVVTGPGEPRMTVYGVASASGSSEGLPHRQLGEIRVHRHVEPIHPGHQPSESPPEGRRSGPGLDQVEVSPHSG